MFGSMRMIITNIQLQHHLIWSERWSIDMILIIMGVKRNMMIHNDGIRHVCNGASSTSIPCHDDNTVLGCCRCCNDWEHVVEKKNLCIASCPKQWHAACVYQQQQQHSHWYTHAQHKATNKAMTCRMMSHQRLMEDQNADFVCAYPSMKNVDGHVPVVETKSFAVMVGRSTPHRWYADATCNNLSVWRSSDAHHARFRV
jgi:hypothetical protein